MYTLCPKDSEKCMVDCLTALFWIEKPVAVKCMIGMTVLVFTVVFVKEQTHGFSQ